MAAQPANDPGLMQVAVLQQQVQNLQLTRTTSNASVPPGGTDTTDSQQAAAAKRSLECLESMLESSNTDMVLVCQGDERVHVHSQLLCVCSEVIRDMWTSCDCQSTSTDRPMMLSVQDDTAVHWMELLLFVYPAFPRHQVSWSNVDNVFTLAHKYNLGNVLAMCSAFLCRPDQAFSINISDSNSALKWLKVAQDCGMTELFDKCLAFLRTHWHQMPELVTDDPLALLSAAALSAPTVARLLHMVVRDVMKGAAFKPLHVYCYQCGAPKNCCSVCGYCAKMRGPVS